MSEAKADVWMDIIDNITKEIDELQSRINALAEVRDYADSKVAAVWDGYGAEKSEDAPGQSQEEDFPTIIAAYDLPSRSGGEGHHVLFWSDSDYACSCIAAENSRKCWAVKGIERVTTLSSPRGPGYIVDETGRTHWYQVRRYDDAAS